MLSKKLFCKAVSKASAAVLMATCVFVSMPEQASGAGRMTDKFELPFNAIVFVPCANGGAGEFVSFNGVWHIVNEVEPFPDAIEHGNWSNAKGTGLITGDRYIVTNAQNSIPRVDDGVSDANFFINQNVIGTGRGAVKFNLQQVLRVSFPFDISIELIRVECH